MHKAMEIGALRDVYNRVAGRYDFQHALQTARADQRGRRMLVTKAVRAGDSVLDCGAGTGSTALLALEKVGLSGKVALFDISDGMLAIAKKRFDKINAADQVEFKIGNMLDLPFADNSFDVVLSTYSMCPLYDPAKGAQELCRVTKPGGRIGVAHSTDPENRIVRWLANKVERVVWHFPTLSLGCRSVSVLPLLEDAGCTITFKKHLGVPLWPFLVFVAEKWAT